MVEIFIGGCVNRPGHISVPRFTSLRGTIRRVGGFRRKLLLYPTGLVSLSRRRTGSKSRHRLPPIDFFRAPSRLDVVRLRQGDRVIVHCSGLYRWMRHQERNIRYGDHD